MASALWPFTVASICAWDPEPTARQTAVAAHVDDRLLAAVSCAHAAHRLIGRKARLWRPPRLEICILHRDDMAAATPRRSRRKTLARDPRPARPVMAIDGPATAPNDVLDEEGPDSSATETYETSLLGADVERDGIDPADDDWIDAEVASASPWADPSPSKS